MYHTLHVPDTLPKQDSAASCSRLWVALSHPFWKIHRTWSAKPWANQTWTSHTPCKYKLLTLRAALKLVVIALVIDHALRYHHASDHHGPSFPHLLASWAISWDRHRQKGINWVYREPKVSIIETWAININKITAMQNIQMLKANTASFLKDFQTET